MNLQYTIEISTSETTMNNFDRAVLRAALSDELEDVIDFYLENVRPDNEFTSLSDVDAELYNVTIT